MAAIRVSHQSTFRGAVRRVRKPGLGAVHQFERSEVLRAARRYLPRGDTLPPEIWRPRHHAILVLLWGHVAVLPFVGVLTHHGALHSLWETGIVAIAGLIATWGGSGRATRMVGATFGLVTSSALLVHFSGGLIEMHFHFFVMVAVITLYQSWLPFLVALAYVVVHHGALGALDPMTVYNHPAAIANSWKWATVHGFFILGESAALLVVWRMNEDARADAETSLAHRLQEEQARRTAQEEADRQREKLEAQLRQSQKMEAVGQLAGGIAHDFNNILSVVINYASFIKEDLAPSDPRRGDIEEISKAGERGAKLIRQMLAFSRREIANPEVLDLNRVVREMENMLTTTLGEDIDLDLKFEENLWPAKLDHGKIEQVIVNLSVNARDAMKRGGRLVIETLNSPLDAELVDQHPEIIPGNYVSLSVSDTGTGMTEEVKARIFEPFFTTKPVGEGTGLGLAVVYGIVKQAGGYIYAYSEPGIGTTFRVYLAATHDHVAASSRSSTSDAIRGGTETILLVEDERAVRELVARILSRAGYTVVSADGAAEAVDAYQAHEGSVDLLLTDVIMPGMSGKELSHRLTKGNGLRTLYMSGYAEEILSERGMLREEEDLIQKPFDVSMLLMKVRNILER